MRNKIVVVGLIVITAMLWPFSCNPQSGVPVDDGCDTLFIESPDLVEKIETFEQMIARLTEDVRLLNASNESLTADLVTANQTIANRDNTIVALNKQVGTLESDMEKLRVDLAECLDRPSDTVEVVVRDTVTVEVPLDYITVDGVEYKVSEIELIRPKREDLTYEMFFCTDTTANRTFIHEGSPTNYPHFINVASKSRGMMKVWFEVPLDSTIKVAKSWILDERRSYETAKTEYVFKSHTKF
jgi:hypothetical protein